MERRCAIDFKMSIALLINVLYMFVLFPTSGGYGSPPSSGYGGYQQGYGAPPGGYAPQQPPAPPAGISPDVWQWFLVSSTETRKPGRRKWSWKIKELMEGAIPLYFPLKPDVSFVICISDAICNILIKLCIMSILMAIIVKHIYVLTLFGSIKGISKMCLCFPPPLV